MMRRSATGGRRASYQTVGRKRRFMLSKGGPIVLAIAAALLWACQPRGLPTDVQKLVAPPLVQVPVLKQSVLAGATIEPGNVEDRGFLSVELVGKITARAQVEYTLALRDIPGEELIAIGAVEHFVNVPMTTRPIDAGETLTKESGIKLNPVRVSLASSSDVLEEKRWLGMLVRLPLEAHATIPCKSLVQPASTPSDCNDPPSTESTE